MERRLTMIPDPIKVIASSYKAGVVAEALKIVMRGWLISSSYEDDLESLSEEQKMYLSDLLDALIEIEIKGR